MIVIGASYGGVAALLKLLPELCKVTAQPIVVVQHITAESSDGFAELLDKVCSHTAVEAEERTVLEDKFIYIAPGGYHLLVDLDGKLSYSKDNKVSYSRPSIDVLFCSAALAFDEDVIAIILTGANEDGAEGIKAVAKRGGVTIAQNPSSAEIDVMPKAAIKTNCINCVLDLKDIPAKVKEILSQE